MRPRSRITKNQLATNDASRGSVGKRASSAKLATRERQKISAAVAEIFPVQERLRPVLRRAWPNGSDKDISWLAADLAGLWKVSRIHFLITNRLFKMGNHPDHDALRRILIDLKINWIEDAMSHIRTLKGEVRRFSNSME